MRTEHLKKYKELVRRHQELLKEYEELLENLSEGESLNEIWPLYPMRPLIIERRCWLAEREPSLLDMLTVPGGRDIGLKELRDFTKNAEDLIVVDPYIFSGPKKSADKVAQELSKSARISGGQLKRIHIVHDQSKATNAVKKAIEDVAKQNSIHFTTAHSEMIHDRVWITDRARALAVGTSLNGIGSRAAFLLSLPKPDLDALLEFMDEQGLSRVQR